MNKCTFRNLLPILKINSGTMTNRHTAEYQFCSYWPSADKVYTCWQILAKVQRRRHFGASAACTTFSEAHHRKRWRFSWLKAPAASLWSQEIWEMWWWLGIMCHRVTPVLTVHNVAARVVRLPQLSVWLSVSSVAFRVAGKTTAWFTLMHDSHNSGKAKHLMQL